MTAPTQPSYLSTLRQIDDIQVPDLASTLLTTPADDEANEATISYLRTNIDPEVDPHADIADQALRSGLLDHGGDTPTDEGDGSRIASERTPADEFRARRQPLLRLIQRLNWIQDAPAYSNRVPNHNSLYDWSPASDAETEEAELQEYMRDIRRQQPNTHPDVLRVLARSQMDADRERLERARQRVLEPRSSLERLQAERESRSQTEASLRSAAILQAVRRHPRFSANSREHARRSTGDRERYTLDSGDHLDRRSRHSGWHPTLNRRPSDGRGTSHDSHAISRARRVFPDMSADDNWLQGAIAYLADIRNSTTYEDSLGYAVDAGFVTNEYFGEEKEDFLFDLRSLPPIAETSLLAPGTVFNGHQHAAADSVPQVNHSRHTLSSDARGVPLWRPGSRSPVPSANRLNQLPPLETLYPHSDWLSNNQGNEWPVQVKIHAVDYSSMTMNATMVAYDVPSRQPQAAPNTTLPLNPNPSTTTSRPPSVGNSASCAGQKSITTYLEGEILDFTHTTLRTERFKATLRNDATYWRYLEPFAEFDNDELVRRLLSRDWMAELNRKYVLMRWKERCFVRPAPAASSSSSPGASDSASPASTAPHPRTTASSRRPPGPREAMNNRIRAVAAAVSNNTSRLRAHEPPNEEISDDCGLTISGFYYVCLRRADGAIEGLYCDPQSSPYQHLILRREGQSAFPAWSFK